MDQNQLLRAGTARAEISPPVGVPLTGYILREGPSTGIHDPLHATALVLACAAVQVAVVSCDVLAFDARFVADTRTRIERATGIPGRHVMLAATHTHSGPAAVVLRDCGEIDAGWLRHLQEQVVYTARVAADGLRPAAIGAGSGQVLEGIANRRRPDGPVDRELGVIHVDDAHGRPMALLVGAGCHPTALRADNRLVSADYPGYVVRALERDSGAVALWLTGAAADVDPILATPPAVSPLDAARTSTDDDGFARAKRLGSSIALEARRVIDAIETSSEADLDVACETLHLPLLPPPEPAALRAAAVRERQLLDEALSAGRSGAARVHRAMHEWAVEVLQAVSERRMIHTLPVEMQVVRLGGALLVGVPGELFSNLGLRIKAAAGPLQTMVVSCANGDIGYIAGREEYALGGYEIEEAFKYYDYPAALAAEAGDQIVASAARLVGRVGEPRS
jgi:hypothetical protein